MKMFSHTFRMKGDNIILVKTPQYIIYFYYPHSKIPSPKRQLIDKLSFFCNKLGYSL